MREQQIAVAAPARCGSRNDCRSTAGRPGGRSPSRRRASAPRRRRAWRAPARCGRRRRPVRRSRNRSSCCAAKSRSSTTSCRPPWPDARTCGTPATGGESLPSRVDDAQPAGPLGDQHAAVGQEGEAPRMIEPARDRLDAEIAGAGREGLRRRRARAPHASAIADPAKRFHRRSFRARSVGPDLRESIRKVARRGRRSWSRRSEPPRSRGTSDSGRDQRGQRCCAGARVVLRRRPRSRRCGGVV